MKKPTQNSRNSFFGILCITFGHSYRETHKITDHISEFKCTHCGREVTNNFTGNLETLTEKYRQANASLGMFYKKKMRRIATTG